MCVGGGGVDTRIQYTHDYVLTFDLLQILSFCQLKPDF